MSNEYNSNPIKYIIGIFIFISMIVFFGTGCKNSENKELYHKFTDKIWGRYNILSFEIPVKNVDKFYNVYLFARFSPEFKYEKLNFNMVMNTSAGEERINEYTMDVKSKSGAFPGDYGNDSCQKTILLTKELKLTKPGILKLEIENLTPRLITEGISGIGIRIVQSGK